MVRRSLRLGLWAGLLLGAAAALVKTMQGRRDGKELATPPADRWAPAPPAPVATAAPTATVPAAAPAGPAPAAPAAAPFAPVQADRWDSEPWPSDITAAPAGDESLGEPEEVDQASPPPRPPRTVKSAPDAPSTRPAVAPRKTVAAAKRVADTAKRTPVVKAITWVRPVAGACPPTHPVKGKLASRLFHLPGMFAYERTRADRCYISEAAAVADGLTRAKR